MGGLARADRLESLTDPRFADRTLKTCTGRGAIRLGHAPPGTVLCKEDAPSCGLTISRAGPRPVASNTSLLPSGGGDFWCDGRTCHRSPSRAGGLTVTRLARSPNGGPADGLQRFNGGLAPWQCKRAKEAMLDDLSVSPSLAEIAATCGLSSRHFLRAFKASNGMSPHRWLLKARVERAREMLEKTAESVGEIANACGFSDQSHLTRTFRKLVGTPPGAWRRTRERRPEPHGSMLGQQR